MTHKQIRILVWCDDEENGVNVQVIEDDGSDLPAYLVDREFKTYEAAAAFANKQSKKFGVEWESN